MIVKKTKDQNKKAGNKKITIFAGILFLGVLFLFMMQGVMGATTTVGPAGSGADHTTIQGAINNASIGDGDTIYVWNGTYYENVIINKSITIDANTSVTLDGQSNNGINITVDNVTIINITVSNCTVDNKAGIFIYNSTNTLSNLTFTNIHVKNSSIGIIARNSAVVNIANANISNTSWIGFMYYNVTDSNFTNNIIYSIDRMGIYLFESERCNISNNQLINSTYVSSDGPTAEGIQLTNSTNCTVSSNIVTQYDNSGILLLNASNNTLESNHVYNNTHSSFSVCGISIYSSDNNTILKNDVYDNQEGIYVSSYLSVCSENNTIYHNNVYNNSQNNSFDSCNNNDWYNTTVNEGNYWGDYAGTDSDGNGIGDTAYDMAGGSSQDLYPLFYNYNSYGSVTNLDTGKVFLTIQNAIDDTNTVDGHTLSISEGTYRENIILNKSVTLTNASDATPIVDGMGGYGINITANNSLIQNITVDNCTSTGFEVGIWVYNSSFMLHDVTLENVTINNTATSIAVDNTTRCNITNCIVQNSGVGICLGYGDARGNFPSNCSNCNISHTTIQDITSWPAGLLIYNSSNNTIYDNTIYNVTDASAVGVSIISSSNYNNITSNYVHNSTIGIKIESSSNNNLTENTVEDNTDYGIYLYSSSNHNNLTNNNCLDNNIGIYLNRGCNYNNITSNNCTGNTESGIYLFNDGNARIGCENNTITNNTCNGLDTNLYGIRIGSSDNYNNYLTNNTCRNNSNSGIYTSSHYTDIINNTCEGNRYGIRLFSTYNNNVTANICNENSEGIRIEQKYGDNNNLTNNTCTLNTHGIRIYGQSSGICDNNTITGNNCSNNNFGIHINEHTERNRIYNNKFVGNSDSNAYDDGTNIWNTTKSFATNIVNGPYLGGNYWDDYTGTDNNGDYIGDTNYSISGSANAYDELPLTGELNILYVDDDYTSSVFGWHVFRWDSIQEAIDNSSSGFTIYVYNGTYTEDVTVNKTLDIIGNSSIHAIEGDFLTGTTLDYNEHGFWVEADYVNISGFYLRCGGADASGVHLNSSNYCNISSNIMYRDPRHGIHLESSDNNTLYNNLVVENLVGIQLENSSYNMISKNNITEISTVGIYINGESADSWNTIRNNKINNSDPDAYGIYLEYTDNETIINNNFSAVDYPVFMNNVTDIIFSSNILDYHVDAISIFNGSNLLFDNNTFTLTLGNYNIYTDNVSQSTFSNNSIYNYNGSYDGEVYGFYLYSSDNNTVINNTIRQTYNSHENNYAYGVYSLRCNGNEILENTISGLDLYNVGSDSYYIYIESESGWQLIDSLHYSKNYETQEVDLTDYIQDLELINLRIQQTGGIAAHIDSIKLFDGTTLVIPDEAYFTDSNEDILNKISDVDYDVATSWEQTIQCTWENGFDQATLYLTANEEMQANGKPLRTPHRILPRYMKEYVIENTGAFTIDGVPDENLGESDFKSHWTPTSGHPWGDTYVWLRSDGENLYGLLEVTADNTYDTTGWGSLYIYNDDELQEFKITASDHAYGVEGFVYTDKVNWEHMVYEFSIPLEEISAESSDHVKIGYASYGTMLVEIFGISSEGVDENPSVSNCNITQNNVSGYYYGILLKSTKNELVTQNNLDDNLFGTYLIHTNNSELTSNTVNNSYYDGISTFFSWNNTVSLNTIINSDDGVYIYNTHNSTFTKNNIFRNDDGIQISGSSQNSTFHLNTIRNSSGSGVYINSLNTNNNIFYHNNFIDNIYHANDSSINTWDNGYPSGGNYWDNHTSPDDYSGPNQNLSGSDNIVDNQFNISGGDNNDSYPLVYQIETFFELSIDAPSSVTEDNSFTVTITNHLGSAIESASVTFRGTTKSTNSNGKASFSAGSVSSDTNYLITATKSGYFSNSTTITVENYVSPGGGGDGAVVYPPTADAGGPYSGTVGSSISFDGSGSSDEDGTIESYAWDFGDESSGSGLSPTHTYTGVDTYTVTLTVTDNSGLTDSDTATVTVEAIPPVAPTADANGPYVGVVNQQITLDGSGSSDSDGSIVSYEWSCGDESSVNGVNPTHSYTTAGTFDVMLTVTDDDGLTDNDTTTATVYDGESVDIPDGFVIDTDDDGTFDSYLNESSGTVTTMEETDDGDYLIDDNNDGTYDEKYDPATGGVTPYSPPPTPVDDDGNLWLYIAIIAIIGIIILIFILIKMGIIVI